MGVHVFTIRRVENALRSLIEGAVEEWLDCAQAAPEEPSFLYYRTPSGARRIGQLKVSTGVLGTPWQTAGGIPLHSTLTNLEARRRIAMQVMKLPILTGPIESLPMDVETKPAFIQYVDGNDSTCSSSSEVATVWH